jgi:hypothetical protein
VPETVAATEKYMSLVSTGRHRKATVQQLRKDRFSGAAAAAATMTTTTTTTMKKMKQFPVLYYSCKTKMDDIFADCELIQTDSSMMFDYCFHNTVMAAGVPSSFCLL